MQTQDRLAQHAFRPVPKNQLIHGMFEEQAHQRGDSIAVVFGRQQLTYAGLNKQSDRIAFYLSSIGVGPGKLVGIYMERGVDMVVSMLAVLKSGGAYLPLDPRYPDKRLEYMLSLSEPAVVLSHAWLRQRTVKCTVRFVALDEKYEQIGCAPKALEDIPLFVPQNLAYVIFTSGSTGMPKGVMVEHRSVIQFLEAAKGRLHFFPGETWSLFHSFAFDFSVLELWGALLSGGRLVVVPYEVSRSPSEFYELLCNDGITVLSQTPSAFRQLITAQRQSPNEHVLRTVILGGEALEASSLKPWYERLSNRRTQLVNMYGPTETTVFVTFGKVERFAANVRVGGCSIGLPIQYSALYILDENKRPTLNGAVGEIYIAGAGVARGYLQRPDLTADRFLADPFSEVPNSRMYRSGDLGRQLEDGSFEYIGRNDSQVKIRGFRVELSEIEANLTDYPGVIQTVAIVREDIVDDRRLVAYLTVDAACVASPSALSAYMLSRVPEYMVPSAFVVLSSFPMTSNGKLDRYALPKPNTHAALNRHYESPQGPVEERLTTIWQDLLGMEQLGRNENFFELGGTSLLGAKLIVAVGESWDMKSLAASIFRYPTVREMAFMIERQLLVQPQRLKADQMNLEEGEL